MDHPLDLSSQTDMDSCKQYQNDMVRDEDAVCQFQNCSCPKKHLTILESPKVITQNKKNNTTLCYAASGCSSQIPPIECGNTNNYKRNRMSPDTDSENRFHPKRRKMERGKQTLGKSSSETDLQSHCSFAVDQQLTDHQQSYTQTYSSSQENWGREQHIRHDEDVYNKNREMEHSVYFDNPMANIWRNKDADQDPHHQQQRERSKTVSHIQRLPKKRAYVRNFSTESNGNKSTLTNGATNGTSRRQLPSNNSKSESTQSCDKRSQFYQSEANDSSSVSSDDSNITDNDKVPVKAREMTEKEKAYLLLKADIMKEIDNDKDKEEDVTTFRKKLFQRAMGAAGLTCGPSKPQKTLENKEKEEPLSESPGEGRITALDYLMSRKLLETEDKAFKPRNHHIHQIINGEKPGRLCLMDIVELQVEVGLA